MITQIATYRKKCKILLEVETTTSRNIIIVGFDNSKKNTEYFFRQMQVNGRQNYEFYLPQSPNILTVYIFDKDTKDDTTYKVISLTKANLPLNPYLVDIYTKDFLDFAEVFCNKCGYLSIGNYTDKKRQFLIKYLNEIIEEDTGHKTPSRIHKKDNHIQVAKKDFIEFTIPMRMAIICHEYSHNFLNNDMNNEIASDLNGLKLYINLGYPYIEGVYAFSRIFDDTPENRARLSAIVDYLESNLPEAKGIRKEFNINKSYI